MSYLPQSNLLQMVPIQFRQEVMTSDKCIMLTINYKYHPNPSTTMKNRSLRSSLQHEPLPFSQEPSINFPSFYYKTMDRVDEHHCVIRVGLKLHQMRRFQEDHLFYLLQIFNKECPRIRIYLISPNLLYGQVKIDVFQKEEAQSDAIELEHGLFQLLKVANQYFAKFIVKTFDQQKMVSQMFENEKFQAKFYDEVIRKVQEQEKRIFSSIFGKE